MLKTTDVVLGGDGELCGVPHCLCSSTSVIGRGKGRGLSFFAPSCQYFNFYKTRVFIKWEGKSK